MKQYKIYITDTASDDIKQHLEYVRNTLHNEQAYVSLKDDFRETLQQLKSVAAVILIDDSIIFCSPNVKYENSLYWENFFAEYIE